MLLGSSHHRFAKATARAGSVLVHRVPRSCGEPGVSLHSSTVNKSHTESSAGVQNFATRAFIPNLHRHCRKKLSGSHTSVDTLPPERSQGTNWEKGFGVQLSFWHKTPHFFSKRKFQCLAATLRMSHVPEVELAAALRATKLKVGGCKKSQKA